jgi:hypothetical protein
LIDRNTILIVDATLIVGSLVFFTVFVAFQLPPPAQKAETILVTQELVRTAVAVVLLVPFALSALLVLVGDTRNHPKVIEVGVYSMIFGFGLTICGMIALLFSSIYMLGK